MLDFHLRKSDLFTEMELAKLDIAPLASGANDVFLIGLKNQKNYVIKIPRPINKKIINRANEYLTNQLTVKADINIPFIYYDLDSGVNITIFEPNSSPLTRDWLRENTNLLKIISLFKQLHRLPIKFMQDCPISSTLQFYQNLLPKRLPQAFIDIRMWQEPIRRLRLELDEKRLPSQPCHNDPILNNFLLTSQNKLYLIDWEYAGNNDPMWDLATFTTEAELNIHQENFFLQQYYEKALDADLRRSWFLYKVLVDYLWVLWWLVISDSAEDARIDNPILIKFNRFTQKISELQF